MMNRRDMLKFVSGSAFAAAAGSVVNGSKAEESAVYAPVSNAEKKGCKTMKKYTNADFYKNGVFQEDVAFQAYYDLFESLGYSLIDKMKGNPEFWVLDFGLGDFEHVGMGGIIWFNNKEFRYFGHDIFLLPGQMIAEHFHLAAEDMPAKHESWQVRYGSIFNFSVGGEKKPSVLAMLPKSQLDDNAISCFQFKEMNVGDMDSLSGIGDPHFMMGGKEGAIVTEYACWHSGMGLNFTNKKIKASVG